MILCNDIIIVGSITIQITEGMTDIKFLFQIIQRATQWSHILRSGSWHFVVDK